HGQRPRPLRHRLRAVHVLRHLRRGLPVRRPLLEPRVRVLRAPHRRPPPRQDEARRVDGDGARVPRARGRRPEREHVAIAAQIIAFGIIAAMMIAGAIRVVTSNNVVHAALWLVVVLAGAAAQYVLLAAGFVATTQILVYVGAVMVLFLFGTMLTRSKIGRQGD